MTFRRDCSGHSLMLGSQGDKEKLLMDLVKLSTWIFANLNHPWFPQSILTGKKQHYITLFTLQLANSMNCVVMENLLQIFLNRPSFSALFFVCTWPSEMCVSGAWKILSAADEACEKVGIISATVTCSLIMLNNVSITSDKGGEDGWHPNIFPISVFQSGFICYRESLMCRD